MSTSDMNGPQTLAVSSRGEVPSRNIYGPVLVEFAGAFGRLRGACAGLASRCDLTKDERETADKIVEQSKLEFDKLMEFLWKAFPE